MNLRVIDSFIHSITFTDLLFAIVVLGTLDMAEDKNSALMQLVLKWEETCQK